MALGAITLIGPLSIHLFLPAMPAVKRPLRPSARAPEGRPADPVSEYARRAGPQGLDPHGRSAPVHNPGDDDQLDIPAFLRRQTS